MKKFYSLLLAVLAFCSISFVACKKDSDTFIPYPGQQTGPDTTWYSAVTTTMPVNNLTGQVALFPDIDSMNYTGDTAIITTTSGLTCKFPSNAIVDSLGNLVTGKIIIQSNLFRNKGGLIRMGLSTISNGSIVVSAGIFSITILQGNKRLGLAPGVCLGVDFPDTSTTSHPAFNLFYGNNTSGSSGPGPTNNWQPNSDPSNNIYASNMNFAIQCNNNNLVNCGYIYNNTSNNVTSVTVKLPANLTNANTKSYLVFTDLNNSVIEMPGSQPQESFTANNNVPLNLNVQIITISKDGNFYYLGQSPVMNSTNSNASQIVNLVPARVTIDSLRNFLSTF